MASITLRGISGQGKTRTPVIELLGSNVGGELDASKRHPRADVPVKLAMRMPSIVS